METGLSTQMVTYVEKSISQWCVWLQSAGIVHPATQQPRDQQGGFSISGKCSEMGEHSNLQIVFLSMKYCLQDTAWHSFSQIFWQFEQISRIWFWFLAPVGHLWRRISSAACAMSLKYPCLPETYAECFPGCGNSYHFPVHQVTLLSPHTIPSPASKEAALWITLLLPVCEERVPVGTTHYSVHVSEKDCDCSHFTVAQRRSSKPRWGVHRHLRAKAAPLCTLLCRARRVCEPAAGHLRRSPGPGRCTWGGARGAFVCAFTMGLSSSISIWVRAHGAARAGVGEVTLWGHTWTWPLYCTAPGTKPACVGRVPSCVTLWLSVAAMGCWGWHNNLFMLKRIAGGNCRRPLETLEQRSSLAFVCPSRWGAQAVAELPLLCWKEHKQSSIKGECRALGGWVGEDLKKQPKKAPWYLCCQNMIKLCILG